MEKNNPKYVAERIHWIDCVKGIGMLLVVLGHIYKHNYLAQWIYTFHIPMFFILSGFLMYNKEMGAYKSYMKKKSYALLLPFIEFRFLLYIYWVLVESKFRELDLGPIWFLLVLFLVECFTYPIFIKTNQRKYIALVAVAFLSAFYFFREVYYFSWGLMYLNASFWFCIGLFLSSFKSIFDSWFIDRYSWVVIIILIAVSFSGPLLNGSVSLYSSVTNNIFFYALFGFIGSVFIFLLAMKIVKENKVLEWIGRNTIVILAIHEPIKRVLIKLSVVMSEHVAGGGYFEDIFRRKLRCRFHTANYCISFHLPNHLCFSIHKKKYR